MTVWLTPQEMASLNRALAKRTGARVRVGPAPISVAQGIALWNAAASFGEGLAAGLLPASRGQPRKSRLASGRDGAPFRRVLGAGAVLAATASLGACTSLGGNIQGNFSCRAPGGICAPTSTIDDAALALIGGDESVMPAGPYSAPSTETPRLIRTAANEPVRSGEKVLRIVFPSHIDRAGRFRETTAIHAVVERAVWTTASASPAPRVSAVSLQEPSQQFPDGANRSLGELASIAPEVRFPDPIASLGAGSAGGPDAAAVTGQAALAADAKPVRVSRVTPAMPRSAEAAAPVAAAASSSASTSTMARLRYSLPPQAVGGAQNPLESIRAQVAQRLKAAAPSVAAPSMASAEDRPAQAETDTPAANRPSLFPVSGVNR